MDKQQNGTGQHKRNLFPNSRMIITNGCVCQIIQISSQQIKVEITGSTKPNV